jgi:hypothetical protein
MVMLALPLGMGGLLSHAQPISVRVERWLVVRQNQGQVQFRRQGQVRAIKSGDRLEAVGDGIITGKKSTAVLEVDTGIGVVQVAENTRVEVRSLGFAADSGRITLLSVPYGQVRLRLRPFTHPGSRLEIQTPAGVSAVRGTEFGVTVQSTGKTGLATLNGSVAALAQNNTVMVPGGFQNLTIPGESPTQAVPLQDNTQLRYEFERKIQRGMRTLRLLGQVDPVNLVFVGETPVPTDRNGQFSLLLPALYAQKFAITVVTPLGRRQVHDIFVRL